MSKRSISLALLTVTLPTALYAQAVGPGGSSASSAASDDVAEIIVTANKRQENINRVGMSVTAITGEDLASRRIATLEDVATAVPGLTFAPSGNNTPILTLRGVGFNESSLGVYPAVSLYVDQAPLPFPVMASHSSFDLERIEVLKGPQGTLFGQNSTGGAINYIAAKPTETFEAGADLSYGRFNLLDGNAFISGPLTDTLGFRLAATGHHMDDWQRSVTRNDTNGHQSYVAGRFLLDWKASDTVRISLNVNGWIDKSQPQAQQLVGVRPQVPAFAATAYPVIVFSPSIPRAADWTAEFLDPALGTVNPATGEVTPGTQRLNNIDTKGNRKFFQTGLRADVDVTDDISLTSLTSYNDFKQRQSVDSDGSAYVIQNVPHVDGYIHSFNQEVRLANATTNWFRWIIGANYERSTTFEYQEGRLLSTAYNPGNLYLNAATINNKQKIRNYAAFGNVEAEIAPRLVLKGAVRYTNSRNKANICSAGIPGGNVDILFNLLGGIFGTVPFTPIGPSDCYTLNENYVPGFPFIQTLSEDNVSWRAGADFQATPTTLFYANVSRGYKAGSFPSISAAGFTGLTPVTQESVTAYEAGAKVQLFDRRVALNGAIFYYDYRGKQVRGRLSDVVFGNLDALINVPKSRILGVEADITVRPTKGLTISGNATYLNSKIQRYVGVNAIGEPDFDHAGDPLPFTPRWTAAANIDYRTEQSWGTPFVGLTVSAKSSSDSAISAKRLDYAGSLPNTVVKPGVTCVYCNKGYATVDARIGLEAADERWKFTVWGKNIFNTYYWTNVIYGYDVASRLAGMPATYGVSLSFAMR